MSPRTWFGLILGFSVLLKIGLNTQFVDWWYDGGYYAEIARNVAEGRGLVSSVSMFHAGFPSFPFATAVYPAWPYLLGVVARVVPLDVAAVWLPTLFYFGTVALMWPIGRRLLLRPVYAEVPGLDAGHVLMLLWALQSRFAEYTSRPYTEGMGFFCLALAVWRLLGVVERPSWRGGVEAGLWCVGIMLVRGPFVVVSGAVLLFLWVMVLLPDASRKSRVYTAISATLSAALFAALVQHLWFDTIPNANFGTLVRFDSWVVQPGLTPVNLLVDQASAAELFWDRLSGVGVAFMLGGKHGYFLNFGYAQYAPLLLLVALIGDLRARRLAVGALLHPGIRPLLLVLFIGFAQLAALQVIHKAVFAEWNFGMRHAIGVLWLFAPPLILLCQRDDSWRIVGRIVLWATLGYGLMESAQRRGVLDLSPKVREQRQALAAWLQEKKQEDPDLRVGHPDPQLIVRWTQGVGFITVHAFSTIDDICLMVRRDGLDYVLLPDRTADGSGFDFLKDRTWFDEDFLRVEAEVPKVKIYQPKEGICSSP